jgi:RNA polymerase sigma-70 factor (ECF subfamily)
MSRFQTTRWSMIEAARDDPARAGAALERLCRAYRPPVLAYIRRHGHSPNDAEDLAQEFFARFLERGWYTEADPHRGRFRSLLLTMLRNFLIDQHARNHALKRGNGCTASGGDAADMLVDPGETPEQAFTRTWLATLVSRAMTRLQAEWERAGKLEQFQRLAPMLLEHADSSELRALAGETGIRSNTLAVQVHRLRRRLRQLVRLELLQTVGNREALEEELSELRGALDDAAA